MANWSELTKDVLGMIHGELSICDYIRFRAVCKHWNLVSKFEDHRRLRAQAPWLMLSGDDNSTAKFFSIVEKKIYKIQRPQPMIGRRIYVGSCHGWLATLDGRCNMHLLNPLTGAQIPLPSVLTLLFMREDIYNVEGQITNFNVEQDYNQYCLWREFIQKVVLSKAPDADKDFTIMMIYSHCSRLAFARAGDKAWTPISSPYSYSDIIYHNAKFYTINFQQVVETWEPHELAFEHIIFIADLSSYDLPRGSNIYYLVESLDSNLMLVHKNKKILGYTNNPKNIMCTIFSLDEETCKWKRVNNLHEQTLFIGKNRSMCLSTIDFPELKQNCIYYTNDMFDIYGSYKDTRLQIGIFYLEDEMTRPIDHLGYHYWPPLLWLTPNFRPLASFVLLLNKLLQRCSAGPLNSWGSFHGSSKVVSDCFHRSLAAAQRFEVELVVSQLEKAVAWLEHPAAVSSPITMLLLLHIHLLPVQQINKPSILPQFLSSLLFPSLWCPIVDPITRIVVVIHPSAAIFMFNLLNSPFQQQDVSYNALNVAHYLAVDSDFYLEPDTLCGGRDRPADHRATDPLLAIRCQH
ncbi:unnamed protein product [Musa banksii]